MPSIAISSSASPPATAIGSSVIARCAPLLDAGLLEDVHATRRAEPDDVREADRRTFDLTVAAFLAQMRAHFPDVGDTGRRDRVTLRLEPSRDVDRRGALAPSGTGVEEVDRAAFGAQHQVVVVHELGRREA